MGADGDVSSFVMDASTKAFQPTGLDRSVVAKDEAGNLVVTAMDGLIYTFDAKGKLTSATAAVDRTQPAAPIYVFDPLVGGGDKVVALKDPVSNRQINLLYSTDP
ncbi:MAG TPA: hypothetical protein VGJ86_20110, partial [Acidimicrobiales bacterium]